MSDSDHLIRLGELALGFDLQASRVTIYRRRGETPAAGLVLSFSDLEKLILPALARAEKGETT